MSMSTPSASASARPAGRGDKTVPRPRAPGRQSKERSREILTAHAPYNKEVCAIVMADGGYSVVKKKERKKEGSFLDE